MWRMSSRVEFGIPVHLRLKDRAMPTVQSFPRNSRFERMIFRITGYCSAVTQGKAIAPKTGFTLASRRERPGVWGGSDQKNLQLTKGGQAFSIFSVLLDERLRGYSRALPPCEWRAQKH